VDVFPSGKQLEIIWRDQRATVVEVGGGIRQYEVGDRPVLDPYPIEAMRDGAHGVPLIPWPNRLADGRYRFDGVDYQVALTEPEKHNARVGACPYGETVRIRGRSTARAPGDLSAAPAADLRVGGGVVLVGVAKHCLGVGVRGGAGWSPGTPQR